MKQLLPLFVLFVALSGNASPGTHQLWGRVTDENGKAMYGANVELLNTNSTAASDKNGVFALQGIAAGAYQLKVQNVDGTVAYQSIEVPSWDSIRISFTARQSLLPEAVVQADKREVPLMQVPAAVSVLNARDVENFRLWTTGQLTGIIPGLYTADPGDNRNVTSIRGITTTSYEPAVATYIDGIAQFSLDNYISELLDIERIEVLRGPQSTLYGRNATGGVVNIITRQPSYKTSGFAEASVGNYGLQRYRAGIRTPFGKQLLAGAAFMYHGLNGYYTNDYNGSHYDKQRSLSGNYFLRWLPTQKWSVLLNVKHQLTRNYGAFPLVMGMDAALENPYHLSHDAVTTMNDQLWNASLAIKYSGPCFQLVSQTGYQADYRYYDDRVDADFSPMDGISIYNNYGRDWNNVRVASQEIRLSSPAQKSANSLTWLAGTYLFHQLAPVKQATVFGQDAPMMGIPDSNSRIITSATARNTGAAFFAQATLPIGSRLRLTGGLRYDIQRSQMDVRSDYASDAGFGFPMQGDTSGRMSYNAFTPRLSLLYLLRPEQSIYATYSKGFRTGGLTQIGSDPTQPALYPYQPEYSHNYELGFKGSFLQNRIRVGIAAFYVDVTGVQIPALILPDAITVTRNGGTLQSKGLELELATTPFKGLLLQYAGGYTHATYGQLKLPHNGAEADHSGNRQIFTPDLTSMLALQYEYGLRPDHRLDLVLRAEWYYIGRRYFDQQNTLMQAPNQLLHCSAGLRTQRQRLMLWVRNATDSRYVDYAYNFGAVHLADPLTYGVTFYTSFW